MFNIFRYIFENTVNIVPHITRYPGTTPHTLLIRKLVNGNYRYAFVLKGEGEYTSPPILNMLCYQGFSLGGRQITVIIHDEFEAVYINSFVSKFLFDMIEALDAIDN